MRLAWLVVSATVCGGVAQPQLRRLTPAPPTSTYRTVLVPYYCTAYILARAHALSMRVDGVRSSMSVCTQVQYPVLVALPLPYTGTTTVCSVVRSMYESIPNRQRSPVAACAGRIRPAIVACGPNSFSHLRAAYYHVSIPVVHVPVCCIIVPSYKFCPPKWFLACATVTT